MSLIHITIDGHTLAVEEGTSLLAAATENGLNIPAVSAVQVQKHTGTTAARKLAK